MSSGRRAIPAPCAPRTCPTSPESSRAVRATCFSSSGPNAHSIRRLQASARTTREALRMLPCCCAVHLPTVRPRSLSGVAPSDSPTRSQSAASALRTRRRRRPRPLRRRGRRCFAPGTSRAGSHRHRHRASRRLRRLRSAAKWPCTQGRTVARQHARADRQSLPRSRSRSSRSTSTRRPTQVIAYGEKIAQLVVQRVERCELVEIDELGTTARGEDGFGSTGILSGPRVRVAALIVLDGKVVLVRHRAGELQLLTCSRGRRRLPRDPRGGARA